MINNLLKKIFISIIIILIVSFVGSVPVNAQLKPLPTYDPAFLPAGNKVDVVPLSSLEDLFSNIIQISVYLVGLAAFVVFIGGGIKYITSGGDPKATQQAQQTITMSLAGLFLLAAAWLLLKFIENFTGVKVTIFQIPKALP